jgi:hypothetical protein
MMANSQKVLSVLGMLCIDRSFRSEFFADPQARAEELVGVLTADEIEQIQRLGGQGVLPQGMVSADFVARLNAALDNVYAASTCPDPPCPDPLAAESVVR